MRAGLMHLVDLAHFCDHPAQVIRKVLVVELFEQEHFENVVVRARWFDVEPAAVSAEGTRVEFFQREAGLEPCYVARDGVLAVAGIAPVLADPQG